MSRFYPYRLERCDWPSGWYYEVVLDWKLWGFCVEVSLGSESRYGREYGIDVQVGPLYVEGGFCRTWKRLQWERLQSAERSEAQ